MSSSSTSNVIGASEHTAKNQWSGAITCSNVGLPRAAFLGRHWLKKHARQLLEIFSNLLLTEQKPQGILLCEVGNFSDPITPKGRERLEEVLVVAFKETGAGEHGPPQFFWGNNETMVAFCAEVQVHVLEPLTKMLRANRWRTVGGYKIIDYTEHGERTLLFL